jgi:hypothetical protein
MAEKKGGYILPGTDKLVAYDVYRKMTGVCETCGQEMENHRDCDGCGILCGSGHLDDIQERWQGHDVCGFCSGRRHKLEGMLGREITWEEFVAPNASQVLG